MSWMRRAWREGLVASAALLAPACGDDEPLGSPGSILVAVDPTTLPVEQGSSGVVIASLTRAGGFAGVVTLGVTGLPSGVTYTITPEQLSGATASATISVAVGETVTPGTYTATITASAQGVQQATTTYQLTVTEPPAGATTVEYGFCDPAQTPIFVAYQDGNGAWQPVVGSTSSTGTSFSFTLTRARGGVLFVYGGGSSSVVNTISAGRARRVRGMTGELSRARSERRARFGLAASSAGTLERSRLADAYQTEVLYASAAELAQDAVESCAQTQPTKTVQGTVMGVADAQYGVLSLGAANQLFIGGTSTNPVTFTDVATGAVDFVGARITTPGLPPDRVVVFRDLDVPDGGALPAPIDFDGPASRAPATANATITGGGGDDLEIFVEVVTAKARALLWFDLAPSPAATRPWAGLGTSDMETEDFHSLVVFASPPGSADYRVALKYAGSVADQTLALGSTMAAPVVSQVGAGPHPRFRFQGTFPAEYTGGASIDVAATEDGGNTFSILATTSYLAASGNALAYDFTMPDVSGLAGFPGEARLTAGANDVSVSAFGFTGPGIFDLKPSLGNEFKASARGATIAVP